MKIGIVGTGQVGITAAAYAMIMRSVGSEIVLVDRKADLAVAQARDILDATTEPRRTTMTLDELRAFVATLDFFGKPVARERGVPTMPWVPAVEYGDNPFRPDDFTSTADERPRPRRRYRIENLGGLQARDGYATREEAIARAQKSIDRRCDLLAMMLSAPGNGDLRRRLGLPEDIELAVRDT